MKKQIQNCLRPLSVILFAFLFLFTICGDSYSQDAQTVIFENVRIFDGTSESLSAPSTVIVQENLIHSIVEGGFVSYSDYPDALRISGEGMTLMPGLIDVHVHMTFGSLSMIDMMNPELSLESLAPKIAEQSQQMLMRGFTAVRDAGGPIFEIKAAIDSGQMMGPRIWPSGATISQTAGHGDFRQPNERSRRFFGQPSRAELLGATFIADGRDEVLTAVRENLRFGASQIKIMAGGGTSSAYDPVDVTQYTFDEMRAAVEAAEDWGTYVMVHAYTPRAIRRAIEAGVKVIEHGQLLDEETMRLVAENDIWLSTQVLRASTPNMDPLRVEKRRPVLEGQARMWPLAKELGVKIAWGTDFLFEPWMNQEQNAYILQLLEWFTPAETLKMVTHDNAQLLALSGLRSPYRGRLGVVEEGALADLLLVNGDVLENIELIASPEENFMVIMKDGRIYKNTLPEK
ncbi:MAG: amidohydrolase family protein [Balneolales bacterium]|nr:amidohydrolase family protein [Balneolales bacterium]